MSVKDTAADCEQSMERAGEAKCDVKTQNLVNITRNILAISNALRYNTKHSWLRTYVRIPKTPRNQGIKKSEEMK